MVDLKKVNTEQRRDEIRRLVEDIGLWNLHQNQLAEKYEVSPQQINKDIQKIIKLIPKQKISQSSTEFLTAFIKAEKEMRKILVQGDNKEKIQATRALSDLGEKYTKLLEDYGFKSKVADEIKFQFINPYDNTLSGTKVAG